MRRGEARAGRSGRRDEGTREGWQQGKVSGEGGGGAGWAEGD